jgi:hypothetical protein
LTSMEHNDSIEFARFGKYLCWTTFGSIRIINVSFEAQIEFNQCFW